MTERRSFKRRVRERMSKTGESYTAARSAVDRKRERNVAARARLAQADEIVAESRLREATGKAGTSGSRSSTGGGLASVRTRRSPGS